MDLILSSNPTLIFAGDLVRIDDRTWLLLGHSDLSATLQSIGAESRNVLAQGGVCLDARLDEHGKPVLFGRYDRGALIPPDADSTGVHQWHRIDVMTYCLDQATTRRLFGDERLQMRATRPSVLGRLTIRDRYAGTWAAPLLSADDYRRASDAGKRSRFLEKLESVMPDLACYLLPFQGYGASAVVRFGPSDSL